MTQEWRRVAAVLADEVRRHAYAELVLGVPTTLSPREHRRALAALESAGLVADGAVVPDAFARLLAEDAPAARRGVDRWLRDGRIEQYPTRVVERDELLAHVAGRLPARDLSEGELTTALGVVADDPVTLRRYLVDAEYLVRSPDGSVYRVPARS
ncbi:DUF2087 domain-containing protein [Galbitalea sp. SE-J8]|uniref:DUF2087 domain-containing protein n=1 Tax=Galbitalea sp. SE-J8 TaxID=3054952 RepID=UPI00259D0FE8|nr:DUF2087 domain-containing protein [Galbitalea sp. SE-J8]MDM4762747.1 DUF2087 domain-containing protein [Galbitalea sp. SE-J8]